MSPPGRTDLGTAFSYVSRQRNRCRRLRTASPAPRKRPVRFELAGRRGEWLYPSVSGGNRLSTLIYTFSSQIQMKTGKNRSNVPIRRFPFFPGKDGSFVRERKGSRFPGLMLRVFSLPRFRRDVLVRETVRKRRPAFCSVFSFLTGN